ncbi:hypothetical protein TrVE_jg11977 [Triparma verrucosa]|uniref:Uncharacterized protein n=2 Tax=Triparma TaxID=722752 RepID=A0A9W7ADQ7_9STRA|nr:hypothetical protein TrST_g4402 [Triparma strigata]GMI02498.1 hypothetical protein TrVE_jg11977 [Triparma verrucosa]
MFRLPLLPLPLKSRPLSLEAADEVQEQQLAVDDAEAELMASAKGKLLKAGELPKFRFDVNQSTPNTKSSTIMNAAREWLRQLSNWCVKAEMKIKIDVGERCSSHNLRPSLQHLQNLIQSTI